MCSSHICIELSPSANGLFACREAYEAKDTFHARHVSSWFKFCKIYLVLYKNDNNDLNRHYCACNASWIILTFAKLWRCLKQSWSNQNAWFLIVPPRRPMSTHIINSYLIRSCQVMRNVNEFEAGNERFSFLISAVTRKVRFAIHSYIWTEGGNLTKRVFNLFSLKGFKFNFGINSYPSMYR